MQPRIVIIDRYAKASPSLTGMSSGKGKQLHIRQRRSTMHSVHTEYLAEEDEDWCVIDQSPSIRDISVSFVLRPLRQVSFVFLSALRWQILPGTAYLLMEGSRSGNQFRKTCFENMDTFPISRLKRWCHSLHHQKTSLGHLRPQGKQKSLHLGNLGQIHLHLGRPGQKPLHLGSLGQIVPLPGRPARETPLRGIGQRRRKKIVGHLNQR